MQCMPLQQAVNKLLVNRHCNSEYMAHHCWLAAKHDCEYTTQGATQQVGKQVSLFDPQQLGMSKPFPCLHVSGLATHAHTGGHTLSNMTCVMYSSATSGVKAAANTPRVLLFFKCCSAYLLFAFVISANLLALQTR